MSFNPITDFIALLRMTSNGVRTERMPGLDYAIEALARAGLITVSVGQTAPTVNQSSTVWFQPATPSNSAEGVVNLFNVALNEYQTATPTLWSELITSVFPATAVPLVDATPGEIGVSLLYARQDHVHPTDISRAPILSPAFEGEPTAPTPTLGDSSNNIATTAFVQETGGVIPPIGSVLPFAGSTAPANWMLAQGQLISRTTFANLFNTPGIGITYGAGDGVTTFGLPDYRGRVPAGVDASAGRLTTATVTSNGLGGTDLLGQTRTLAAADIPTITASGSGSASVSGALTAMQETTTSSFTAGGVGFQVSASTSIPFTASGSASVTTSSTNTGGSTPTAVSALQPTIVQQYIIRVS